MATNVKFRIVAVVVTFTILLGVYTATLWRPDVRFNNFFIYYTAADFVRSNESIHIYDAIDPGTNPEIIFSDPNTVWAQRMISFGIYRTSLYLYPPTLADLMVPLTILSPSAALIVWNALGVLMILGLSVALTKVLGVKFFGSTFLVAAVVLLFRPTLNTIYWGQVTILLMFLLTIGFSLYANGHKNIAAFLFVLAIAIKLEPIVVIIPIIVWRDWKCLRYLVIWSILLCLGLWAVNGSDALNLYFLHHLPAMSGGELGGSGGDIYNNRSLGNIFYTYLGGAHPVVSSRAIGWLYHVVSALILCYAGWLSRFKQGENSTYLRQFEIGMIFLLFMCCLSPYSWLYNWALSAPVLVIFCKRAWDGRMDTAETVLFIAFLLSLATSKFNMPKVTPILGVTLGIVALYRIRLERRPAESNNPMTNWVTKCPAARSEVKLPPPELSIIIPAYNEEGRLLRTLGCVHEYLTARGVRAEVIVVDDGSTDATAKKAEELRKQYPELRLVSNERNRGKGFSVRRGMLEAIGEIALFTDADLSAPIEEADALLKELRENDYDVAIGSRALNRKLIEVHQSSLREMAGMAFNRVVRLFAGLPFSDTQCGFKAFRRERTRIVFEQQRTCGFGFDPEILYLAHRHGLRVAEVPVRWAHDPATKLNVFVDGIRMFLDLLAIRWNALAGRYPRAAKRKDGEGRGGQ